MSRPPLDAYSIGHRAEREAREKLAEKTPAVNEKIQVEGRRSGRARQPEEN